MCLFAETHYTAKCRPLLRLSDHEISLFIPSLDITGGDVQRNATNSLHPCLLCDFLTIRTEIYATRGYTDGAGNLRSYYPDFVAVDDHGTNWLLETKGQETEETKHKTNAATLWCENANALTSKTWKYLKVPQKEFERLQPETLADVGALLPTD
jgi:hypothetical protein